MPRRKNDGPPQFENEREATAWAIMVASLASTAEDLGDAASEADDLLSMWRDRHEEIDRQLARLDEPDEGRRR